MKKLLLILFAMFFTNSVYAEKLLKSGFINKEIKIIKDQSISNPQNKIYKK